MPRIAAPTVAEHAAQQEEALIDAAAKLFAARGAGGVTLADVAAEVGLARNSVYRYFPDKAHLLAAWYRREMAPLLVRSREVAGTAKPAGRRLQDWIALQVDYLGAPEHRGMLSLAAELGTLPSGITAEIGRGHQELYGTLRRIVEDMVTKGADPDVEDHERIARATVLISGLIRGANDLIVAGQDPATVTTAVVRAARALVR